MQKRPIISKSLLIEATPYASLSVSVYVRHPAASATHSRTYNTLPHLQHTPAPTTHSRTYNTLPHLRHTPAPVCLSDLQSHICICDTYSGECNALPHLQHTPAPATHSRTCISYMCTVAVLCRGVAVCGSVLQCVAVCCRGVAVCCSVHCEHNVSHS